MRKKNFVETMLLLCSVCYTQAKAEYGSKFTSDVLIKGNLTGFENSKCCIWDCKNGLAEWLIAFKRGRTLVFPQRKDHQAPPPAPSTYITSGPTYIKPTHITSPITIQYSGRRQMDTKKLEQITKDAINTKVTANEEFTAFDITKELRKTNPNEEVDHVLVRAIVQEEYRKGGMGGMQRESRDFNGKAATIYTNTVAAPTTSAVATLDPNGSDDAANDAVKAAMGDN